MEHPTISAVSVPKPSPPNDDPLAELADRIQAWVEHPRWQKIAPALSTERLRRFNLCALVFLILFCLLRLADSGLFFLFAMLLVGVVIGVLRDQPWAHGANVALSVMASIGAPFLLVLGKLYTDRSVAGGAEASGSAILLLVLLLTANASCSLIWLWRERYRR